ncbi:hypothetical protein ACG3SL_18115 [Sphingomonas sp. CJ20]
MSFLRKISPIGAIRDLRMFLAQRRPHELWFMMLSMAITLVVLFVFVKDSHIEVPYKRNIIYAESWPITRTDDEIRADRKIDNAKRAVLLAEAEKKRKQRQEEFKRVDDTLTKWGF